MRKQIKNLKTHAKAIEDNLWNADEVLPKPIEIKDISRRNKLWIDSIFNVFMGVYKWNIVIKWVKEDPHETWETFERKTKHFAV